MFVVDSDVIPIVDDAAVIDVDSGVSRLAEADVIPVLNSCVVLAVV